MAPARRLSHARWRSRRSRSWLTPQAPRCSPRRWSTARAQAGLWEEEIEIVAHSAEETAGGDPRGEVLSVLTEALAYKDEEVSRRAEDFLLWLGEDAGAPSRSRSTGARYPPAVWVLGQIGGEAAPRAAARGARPRRRPRSGRGVRGARGSARSDRGHALCQRNARQPITSCGSRPRRRSTDRRPPRSSGRCRPPRRLATWPASAAAARSAGGRRRGSGRCRAGRTAGRYWLAGAPRSGEPHSARRSSSTRGRPAERSYRTGSSGSFVRAGHRSEKRPGSARATHGDRPILIPCRDGDGRRTTRPPTLV